MPERTFLSDFDTCVVHLKEHGINAPIEDIRKILDPKEVMLTYNSEGGTGKKAVLQTMANLKIHLDRAKSELANDKARVEKARSNCRAIAKAAGEIKSVEGLKSLVKKYT